MYIYIRVLLVFYRYRKILFIRYVYSILTIFYNINQTDLFAKYLNILNYNLNKYKNVLIFFFLDS